MNKDEYFEKVLQAVLRACSLQPTQDHTPFDELRRRLDSAAPETLFAAGVADFWLNLSKQDGSFRRQHPPPASPFKKRGHSLMASKRQVIEWDIGWRAKDIAKIMRANRVPQAQEAVEKFLRQQHPMCMSWSGDEWTVVGHAAWLPANAGQLPLADLDVQWMRPDQALRKPWRDRQSSLEWLSLFKAARQLDEAHLECMQAEWNTGGARGKSRGIERM